MVKNGLFLVNSCKKCLKIKIFRKKGQKSGQVSPTGPNFRKKIPPIERNTISVSQRTQLHQGVILFFCKKRESGPFKKTIAWHFEHYKMITSKRKQTNYNKIYCKLIFYKNISLSFQALYFIQIQRFSNKKLQISKVSIHFQQTKKVLYFIQ